MPRLSIKPAVFHILGGAFAASLKRRLVGRYGLVTILNLHRVSPPDGSAYEPLAPQLFEDLVRYCVRNYDVVTFAELAGPQSCGKPPLVLSFDDSYRDFLEFACPILARCGVRANMNVIPGCVEKGRPPLNVIAQDFIGQAPQSLLSELFVPGLSLKGLEESRGRLARAVSAFIKNRPIAEQVTLGGALWPQFERLDNFSPTALMSKAEIAGIARVHELGAHSFDHATLQYETDDYAAADARRCADWFRSELCVETTIYAFPNGSFRESQVPGIRAAGFTTLLAVGEDFSTREASLHSRFTFHANQFAEARFRATGAFRRPRRTPAPRGSSSSAARVPPALAGRPDAPPARE